MSCIEYRYNDYRYNAYRGVLYGKTSISGIK